MDTEPTNKEILEVIKKLDARSERTEKNVDDVLSAVNDFSTKMDKRFDGVDGRLDKVEGRLDKVEKDVGYLKSNMVTKDDLDRALAKQSGDLILTMRKEDTKLRELISIMQDKKMLTPAEVRHIISMEPFAQLSV